jgi:hypothetical protein
LRGFYEEAHADCVGVQIQAWVAMALGAGDEFSRASAREYWLDFQLPRVGEYQSAECRDGGRLDLFPERSGWPAPLTYPADLDVSLSALENDLRAAGISP